MRYKKEKEIMRRLAFDCRAPPVALMATLAGLGATEIFWDEFLESDTTVI